MGENTDRTLRGFAQRRSTSTAILNYARLLIELGQETVSVASVNCNPI